MASHNLSDPDLASDYGGLASAHLGVPQLASDHLSPDLAQDPHASKRALLPEKVE